MKQFRNILISLIVGGCIGFWIGMNLGKGQSVFSNPFAEVPLSDRIKQTGEKIIEKSGEVIEKSGQKLEQSGQAIKKKVQEGDSTSQ